MTVSTKDGKKNLIYKGNIPMYKISAKDKPRLTEIQTHCIQQQKLGS